MGIIEFGKRGSAFVARRASGTLRRWHQYLLHDRRGHGRPKSKEQWDHQYSSGLWDRFESTGELPRYMVLLGYISMFPNAPRILDVGCGNGRLAKLLQDFSVRFSSYTGIDLSSEAVAAIDLESRDRMDFEVADFDTWQTTRAFDVIVFNETLYYAQHPETTLERYLSLLSADGAIIVSMCRSDTRHLIWKKLDGLLRFPAQTTLETEGGTIWDVRMGFPRSA